MSPLMHQRLCWKIGIMSVSVTSFHLILCWHQRCENLTHCYKNTSYSWHNSTVGSSNSAIRCYPLAWASSRNFIFMTGYFYSPADPIILLRYEVIYSGVSIIYSPGSPQAPNCLVHGLLPYADVGFSTRIFAYKTSSIWGWCGTMQ